jgi:hypothetical protein
MVRNNHYVQSKKSPSCTIDYLLGVKNGIYKCPRYDEVRLRPCPVSPSKDKLVAAIRDVEKRMDWDFGIEDDGPQPNTAWLITILSTYAPTHEFFSKGYRPRK